MAKKMRLKMKNRSSRYNINRPRRWYGHRYTKYKVCLNIMMVISIRQHLSYIWSLIHEKLSNTYPVNTGCPGRLLNVLCMFNLRHMSTGETDLKKALLIKNPYTSSLAKFSIFPFLITKPFFEINMSVEFCHNFRKNFTQKGFIVW